MISDNDIDAAIRTESDLVWAMLARRPLKFQKNFRFFQLTVAVFVHESVETRTLGAIASYVNVAIERQDALNVLDKFTIDAALFGSAIFVGIVDKDQWPSLLRSNNVPELVKGHRYDRSDGCVIDDFIDNEARLRRKPI